MSRPLRIQYPDAWYHLMNREEKEGARQIILIPGVRLLENDKELMQIRPPFELGRTNLL